MSGHNRRDSTGRCAGPFKRAPVSPDKERHMVEVEEAFKAVVDDFVNSAESEDQLSLFLLIATAAWNLSLRDEEDRRKYLTIFIERFNCPSYTWKGERFQTRDTVLELCDRKVKMYPELRHVIRSLDVEGAKHGLAYSIVSEAVE